MKKFLVVYGVAREFNEDNPNIAPLEVADAIERCKEDGSDLFPQPAPGEPKPVIEDDGSDHYYRLTKTRNFTVHEVNDLMQALWVI